MKTKGIHDFKAGLIFISVICAAPSAQLPPLSPDYSMADIIYTLVTTPCCWRFWWPEEIDRQASVKTPKLTHQNSVLILHPAHRKKSQITFISNTATPKNCTMVIVGVTHSTARIVTTWKQSFTSTEKKEQPSLDHFVNLLLSEAKEQYRLEKENADTHRAGRPFTLISLCQENLK
jgi:hypothetical protein